MANIRTVTRAPDGPAAPMIGLRLDPADTARLDEAAARRGLQRSAAIRAAIEAWIADTDRATAS